MVFPIYSIDTGCFISYQNHVGHLMISDMQINRAEWVEISPMQGRGINSRSKSSEIGIYDYEVCSELMTGLC